MASRSLQTCTLGPKDLWFWELMVWEPANEGLLGLRQRYILKMYTHKLRHTKDGHRFLQYGDETMAPQGTP